MVVRELSYRCDCCGAASLVRSGENRSLPGSRACEAPCPGCNGTCYGSMRPAAPWADA